MFGRRLITKKRGNNNESLQIPSELYGCRRSFRFTARFGKHD